MFQELTQETEEDDLETSFQAVRIFYIYFLFFFFIVFYGCLFYRFNSDSEKCILRGKGNIGVQNGEKIFFASLESILRKISAENESIKKRL